MLSKRDTKELIKRELSSSDPISPDHGPGKLNTDAVTHQRLALFKSNDSDIGQVDGFSETEYGESNSHKY